MNEYQRLSSSSIALSIMNEELISSAISFLKDPNVQSSPLTKKIEFLESKGLNQAEIEEAMKRANEGQSQSQSHGQSQPSQSSQSSQSNQLSNAPLDYYNVPPQVPDRSWKDYFIMATATAGVTYGLYQVVSKYLVPSIIPAKQSSIDEDKSRINEEFIKIDKVLEVLEEDQNQIKSQNEEKCKELDIVIDNVNDFLSKYNKDKLKFDDDLKLMKLEIDNLKNSVEKNMNLTKENIKDELQDISEELTSLKNLIRARSSELKDSARKVPPVSSIPSALEILKKAKSGSSTPESQPTSSANSAETKPTTVDNVTAAGIPEWQAKHKEAEGIPSWQAKQKDEGIPSWQTKDKPENGIPSWQTNASDDKVAKSIANVGVPSWQLNASSSSS